MDDLHKYVFEHYQGLFTSAEQEAYRELAARLKSAGSPPLEEALVSKHLAGTPEAKRLVSLGWDQFQVSVADRLLSEEASNIVLTRCPRCGALARTPQSRQCPKCFHSWRE